MYNILQLYENLFYENNKNHEKLTKLWKADKTSFVEDYTTSWKDCNNISEVKFYFSFEPATSFKNLILLGKLVWRSFLFVLKLLNQLG